MGWIDYVEDIFDVGFATRKEVHSYSRGRKFFPLKFGVRK